MSVKGAKLKSLETNAFSLPASLAMVIKAFFVKLLSPMGEFISRLFLLNWSLYKETEITDYTISKLSIVGALKINTKYIHSVPEETFV